MLRKKIKDLSEAMHQLTQTVIPTDIVDNEMLNRKEDKDDN